jgi:hypothetical protein
MTAALHAELPHVLPLLHSALQSGSAPLVLEALEGLAQFVRASDASLLDGDLLQTICGLLSNTAFTCSCLAVLAQVATSLTSPNPAGIAGLFDQIICTLI